MFCTCGISFLLVLYILPNWDHNGNKCLHFFVSSFYLMYFVFIYYAYLYNVLHSIQNKSIHPSINPKKLFPFAAACRHITGVRQEIYLYFRNHDGPPFKKYIYIQSLPYYRGHYFHTTPLTMFRWRVMVLSIFRYTRSRLSVNIYFLKYRSGL